ncbi:MAG: ABC transporter substrate-binding protein [Polyangiaceae bacterium]
MLGLSMTVALAASGCRREDARPERDRPLEILVSSEPETLDPRYAVDSVSHRITRLLHAGLTRLDEDTLAPKPYVAERLELRDPTTLEVTLKPGLRFHSGAPLGARDVVATLRAWGDPRLGVRSARVVDPIASVEETGPLSLVVRLKHPHATILSDLEVPILRADEATSPPRPDGRLDGLGPYRALASVVGAVHLAPASGGPLAASRPVDVRTVRDENARALRLVAGRADAAVNVISPTLLPALEREPGLRVVRRPGANVTYVLLRTDRPPFDRVEARRAVDLAIDREALTRGLLAGAAAPARGTLPPTLVAGDPSPPRVRDLVGARAAIAAAGGALRFTLLTTPDRLRLSVARTVAQELGDVGAEATVSALELGTLLARLTAGEFDAAILNMPELTEPNVLRLFLHSASIPPAGVNRGRVRDPIVDALLDRGASTVDPAVRTRAYADLEARLRETCVLIPLWYEDQVAVLGPRAQGFVPSAEGRWLGLARL